LLTTNLPLDNALTRRAIDLPGYGPQPSIRLTKTLGEVIGERAASRLYEMCTIVDLTGTKDYRQHLQAKRGTKPFD
jgi:hypothetical protein